MTTFPHNPTQAPGSERLSFKQMNANINALMKELQQAALLPGEQPPTSKSGKLLKIYETIKPVLVDFSRFVLLPINWRNALKAFLGALDEVVSDLASFKAGKDL